LKLERLTDEKSNQSSSINELIEFLSAEIHPMYYLIKCLKKSIGFHHSKLPDIVRKEIEDIFKQGDITTLYCTSTLLQGVNLPANNLFITSPRKRNISLSPFEFGNLIGRAGRIKDSLYGIIYCIEGNDEDKHWAEQFYNANYEKEITLASSKSFENLDFMVENLQKTAIEIRDDSVSYAITFFRQKYLKSPDIFKTYLKNKGITSDLCFKIFDEISSSLSEITLDKNVIALNPTIDPILQNKLYLSIKKDGIEKWVFHPKNKNFNRIIGFDYLNQYTYENYSFYWQLATICEKLNEIFNLSSEAYFKHDISLSIKSIAYLSYTWVQNKSLKEIILDDLEFHANKRKDIDINSEDDVNIRINEVINVNTKIITFLMVKYFKLLTDILESIMTNDDKEIFRFTLSIPVMLELGTTEPTVIKLITSGMTRSVALRIFSEFKKTPNYKELNIFEWVKNENNLIGIDKIFVRYLKKLKFTN